MKAVLNDDVLYEEALAEAFPQYNKSQMISLEMPGGIGDVKSLLCFQFCFFFFFLNNFYKVIVYVM